MLTITIPAIEFYDEANEEFSYSKEKTIQLEHSLVSLSKWESKWKKPFLSKDTKTEEEAIDYIKCMTITQNVEEDVYQRLSSSNMKEINSYIEADMTATKINSRDSKTNREVITAEVIYYWLIAMNIPFECQKWHLNRLLTLINVCSIKNAPPKKMSQKDLMRQNADLNSARKQALNTGG